MKRIILLSTISIFCLSSCLVTPRYLQAPNSTNLIQIDKKNDIKAAVSYAKTGHGDFAGAGTKQRSNGLDIQTAYGVTNKFAIKLDAFGKWEHDKDLTQKNAIDNYHIAYKRKGAELSIGYYKSFGKKNNFNFNIYAGVGIGNNYFSGFFRNDSMINRTYSANHNKWFVVPSVTLIAHKNYSLLFAFKFSVLKFNNINTDDKEMQKSIYKNLAKKNSSFGDFVMDNQFGFNEIKGIKFHIMYGSTELFTYFPESDTNVNGSSYNSDQYLNNNYFGSIGVIADMKTLLNKK